MDKTPKFTAKINEILKNLVPYRAKCSQCNIEFEILEKDITKRTEKMLADMRKEGLME